MLKIEVVRVLEESRTDNNTKASLNPHKQVSVSLRLPLFILGSIYLK